MSLTPDELAALERLRANDYSQPGAIFDFVTQNDDRALCAAALLRLVSEDDGEAIDKPWLLEIGGKAEDNRLKVIFERDDNLPIGLWDVDDGWKAMLIIAEYHAVQVVRGLKTRGDLRRLAAALGVTLKETSK